MKALNAKPALTQVDKSPLFEVGQSYYDKFEFGPVYYYLEATVAAVAGEFVTQKGTTVIARDQSDAEAKFPAVAQANIMPGEFGWFQVKGLVKVPLAAPIDRSHTQDP